MDLRNVGVWCGAERELPIGELDDDWLEEFSKLVLGMESRVGPKVGSKSWGVARRSSCERQVDVAIGAAPGALVARDPGLGRVAVALQRIGRVKPRDHTMRHRVGRDVLRGYAQL